MTNKNEKRIPEDRIPPFDIREAAEKVAAWFKERGIDDWKLGDIQSRQD